MGKEDRSFINMDAWNVNPSPSVIIVIPLLNPVTSK